jgi:hypothetical protein
LLLLPLPLLLLPLLAGTSLLLLCPGIMKQDWRKEYDHNAQYQDDFHFDLLFEIQI